MKNLSTLRTLYEQDRTNDSILLSILHNIIELKSGAFLTEKGQQYLAYIPSRDLLTLDDKNETKENVQQSIVCLGLYFTLIYVSANLFLGLIEKPENIEKDNLDFLLSLVTRTKELLTISVDNLNRILPYLNDEYAKIYHIEKIWFFHKDIYKCRDKLEMPSTLPKNSKNVTTN